MTVAYCELHLRGGHIALIDVDDYSLIRSYWWTVQPLPSGRLYISAKIGSQPVRMHTLLMQPGPGLEVDHHNNNGLDNRRSNLRSCTRSQNNGNAILSRANTSGYKGVSWNKRGQKWEAYIMLNYKRYPLGRFTDLHEAARAYNRAALAQWGEFARLNEIPNNEGR
jgi:hypothetical protein